MRSDPKCEPFFRAAKWILFLAAAGSTFANDLAPSGTLRAAFLADDPAQGHVDRKTGAAAGPVADIVREIARRLRVKYTIEPEPNARAIMDRLEAHTADIGFLVQDTARAKEVDFSHPYLLVQNTYVVRTDAPFVRTADLDRPRMRVGAVEGEAPQTFLSSNLKRARILALPEAPSPDEIQQMILTGRVDAFAGNRDWLEQLAGVYPDLRVLDDDFLDAGQAVAVTKGDTAKLDILNRLLDEMQRSGYIAASVERARIPGGRVPPADAK